MDRDELDCLIAAILAAGSAAGRLQGAGGSVDATVTLYRIILGEVRKGGGAMQAAEPKG